MARNSPQITIQECSGERFADLHAAQDAARAYVSADLAALLRKMIEAGLLEIKDGRITPKA